MNKTAVMLASFLGGYLIAGTTAMANSHSGSIQTIPGMTKHPMKPSKKDNKVYYKNGKAYCKTPYQLFYTPPKDQFFCTITGDSKYISVDSMGNPHCQSPYKLNWTNDRSRLFAKGRKPICTK